MAIVSELNGNQNPGLDDGSVTDAKSKRHPRWTRQETLTLIQAKEITENSPHKGRKISSALLVNAGAGAGAGAGSSSSSPSLLFDNTEPKWVMISCYCKQQGVKRGPAQCKKRWSNLIGDFRKVKNWESKMVNKADSFWNMRNDLRKEKKLPVTFDVEVFKVLEGRETGAAGAVSPLPLQAVPAAAAVSDDAEFGSEEGGDDDEVDEEDEKMQDGAEVLSEIKNKVQETLAITGKLDDVKSADNVTEEPVKNFCIQEPISEEQHHQAFQKKNKSSNQDTSKESRPNFSNEDSQGKGKRQRLSTDECKANCSEEQLLKVLEENNRLLNAQLESHNKNCQLEREQRKQNNNELMSTLSNLTDVLSKIAEKL
ncbi:trihelix transcription factor ASR3-like [Chenopodium quinoa]|uniref:trihelix transcription factor ASR3-like n=1 Tax=Chenopodium quinoa TaxID=63459 RepID=UPI000B773F6F|nr:trihelix transcription factor ASR3-like [Chenopodium quinoa]